MTNCLAADPHHLPHGGIAPSRVSEKQLEELHINLSLTAREALAAEG